MNSTDVSTLANVTLAPNDSTVIPPFSFFPPIDTDVPFYVSPEVYEKVVFYGNLVLSPILVVTGLFGNSIGLYIIYNDRYRKDLSIYIYMMTLMILDTVFLFLGVYLSVGYIIGTQDRFLANKIFTYSSFAGGYFDFLTFHASSVLLVVMSVERLHALVSPFTFKSSWLARHPHRISVGIVVFFMAILLPYPFCFELLEMPDFFEPDKIVVLILPKPEWEEFYRQYGFCEGIVSLVYPILLVILNIAIPIAYRWFQQRRQKMNVRNQSEDNQQLKITIIIFVVTVLYILLSIPKIFIQILVFIDERYNFTGIYGLTFFLFTSLGDVFGRINAANDFVIYILLAKHYRRLLKLMFCRRCIDMEEVKEWSEFESKSGSKVQKTMDSKVSKHDDE